MAMTNWRKYYVGSYYMQSESDCCQPFKKIAFEYI